MNGAVPLAVGLLLQALPAASQEIQIMGSDCRRPVHLVAHEAPLSVVLRRLSETLRFGLVYRSQSDPVVTTDERLAGAQLVRKLVRDVNFSVVQVRDARCLDGSRVSRLFVLPGAGDGNPASVIGTPAEPSVKAAPAKRAALSDYLRSQGIQNQPVEELALPNAAVAPSPSGPIRSPQPKR